jgi:plastocyanin
MIGGPPGTLYRCEAAMSPTIAASLTSVAAEARLAESRLQFSAGPRAAPAGDAVRSTTPARSALVSIFDNAFHLGQDRPAVRLRPRATLTWRWLAQQSHQVTLLSGPKKVQSPTRTAGEYAVKLDKPGTYTFVCSIHAPGMRMSAVVR